MRNTRSEYFISDMPSITDIARTSKNVRVVPGTDSCAATKSGRFRNSSSGVQLVKQSLCLLQIARVEAFGEPAVHRSKEIAGFIPPALIAIKPRQAHRRAQLP